MWISQLGMLLSPIPTLVHMCARILPRKRQTAEMGYVFHIGEKRSPSPSCLDCNNANILVISKCLNCGFSAFQNKLESAI